MRCLVFWRSNKNMFFHHANLPTNDFLQLMYKKQRDFLEAWWETFSAWKAFTSAEVSILQHKFKREKDSKRKFASICNTIGTKHDSQELTLTRFATEVQQVSKKIGEKKRIVKPLETQITSRYAQFTNVLLQTW